MTAVWARTRAYRPGYSGDELPSVPCFVCGDPSACSFGCCATKNRWYPLCDPCHIAVIRELRRAVSERGGRKYAGRATVLPVVLLGMLLPDDDPDTRCHRCTTRRGRLAWGLWKGRRVTLLCVSCDIYINEVALRALLLDDVPRRIAAYCKRLALATARGGA